MTNRYQKEIEEILKKAGEPAPAPEQQPESPGEPAPEPRPRRRSMRQPQGNTLRRTSISYKHLLLAGVAVLVVSIFFGGIAGVSHRRGAAGGRLCDVLPRAARRQRPAATEAAGRRRCGAGE